MYLPHPTAGGLILTFAKIIRKIRNNLDQNLSNKNFKTRQTLDSDMTWHILLKL